jgi:hypothetical protein
LKKSKYVPLLVIGSMIVLTGCEPERNNELKQQTYNSLDDCKKDWDENNCSSTPYGGSHGSVGSYYYGPRYYWDRSIGKPVSVASDGTKTEISNSRVTSEYSASGRTAAVGSIKTGGFGSMAHGFSGGG